MMDKEQLDNLAADMGLAPVDARGVSKKNRLTARKLRKLAAKNGTYSNEAMVRHDLINRMTNWQRNQWGKAGSPLDLDSLKRFMTMPRPEKAAQ